MSCDALWVPRRKKGEQEEINFFFFLNGKTMLIPPLLLPNFKKENKSHGNMKDRNNSRYIFMGTHDK